jgi:hypothetical protein
MKRAKPSPDPLARLCRRLGVKYIADSNGPRWLLMWANVGLALAPEQKEFRGRVRGRGRPRGSGGRPEDAKALAVYQEAMRAIKRDPVALRELEELGAKGGDLLWRFARMIDERVAEQEIIESGARYKRLKRRRDADVARTREIARILARKTK